MSIYEPARPRKTGPCSTALNKVRSYTGAAWGRDTLRIAQTTPHAVGRVSYSGTNSLFHPDTPAQLSSARHHSG